MIYTTLVGAFAIIAFFTVFFAAGYALAAIRFWDPSPKFSATALYGIFFILFLLASYGVGLALV